MQIQLYNHYTQEGKLYQGDEEKIIRMIKADHPWVKGDDLTTVLASINRTQAWSAGSPAKVEEPKLNLPGS